jgi:hypothetical protein
MKLNFNKRDPVIPDTNLGPPKTCQSSSWRTIVFVAVGMLGMFHDAHSAQFIITTIAGTGSSGYSGDGGPATEALINHPTGGQIDDKGNLYFHDWDNHAIRQINFNTGIITTVAGGTLGGGFKHPASYIDSMGNLLYISDYGNHVIYKVNSDGTTSLIAGTIGVAGYKDGSGENAKFNHPAMLIKEGNNLYIGDFYNHRIRKMNLTTNEVTTIAGTGVAGFKDGSASSAQFNYPGGLTLVEESGTKFLYIADYYNHRIRKLKLDANGNGVEITTVAGSDATPSGYSGGGYSGDGGDATDAQLNVPTIAVFDSAGNMYITDHRNHVIRKVDANTKKISTFAGTGTGGYNNDNIPADQAQLNFPLGLAVDSEDNLYIADYGNHRIRKITKNSSTGGCESRFRLYSWPNNPPDFGTELVGSSTSMKHYAYAYTWGDKEKCKNGPTVNDINLSGANASEFAIQNKVCKDEPESFGGLFSRYHYCQFNTVFSPTSEGTKEATLTATFDSKTLTQPLVAKAVKTGQPTLEISPTSLDFGTVKVGSGFSKIITIKNTGHVNLKISDVTVSGATSDNFSIEWPGCDEGVLKPANECRLHVSFIPTSAGAKQASLTVTSNAGSDVITATGNAKDLVDCSDDNITIQTRTTAYNHAWALDSDGDGNYTDHISWDQVWADKNGDALNRVPNENDVVRINNGHYITGIPDAKVKALCVEKEGALVPTKGESLEIHATEGISNKGIIGKVEDVNDLPWVDTSSGTDWTTYADGSDEGSGATCSSDSDPATNAQKGSDVILRSDGPIFNEGKIVAGNGGNGSQSGAAGGSATVRGSDIINKGTIRAGKGGDIYGTSYGTAGNGGLTTVSSNHKHLYNEEFFNSNNVWEKPNIHAGNGGNCTCDSNTDGQAGNGGDLRLTAYKIHLDGGNYGGGMAGTGCATLGSDGNGWVIIDPNVISLANANTKVRGGNAKIFGGKDWILDLRNLSGVVIDATDNVTLAVGENGAIDLRGNNGPIIKAGGIVQLFADIILLDDGVKLSDLIQATDIVLGPNKILYDVSLTGAGKKTGEPEIVLPVRLTLANNGPEKDTYTLNVTDTAGWTLGELPATMAIGGLEFIDLVVDVTLPTARGATNVITVTATSQADPEVKSIAKVHVSVKNMTYTISGSILDKSGQPVKGITVEIEDKTVVTDEQGHFEIAGLLSGDYTLNVSKEGHNLVAKDFTFEGDDSVIEIDIEIDTSVAVATPATCQLYAVNDKGLNNSQFFTVSLDDLTIGALGPMYEGYDIEALAIHPKTDMVYAASGDDVTNGKPGHFYRVDGKTGKLISVGSTGFNEIEDLAFSPDGTLYAWAKGEGLITIDLATGKGTLVFSDNTPIEGLTLKKNKGNVFFGAVGTDLLRYDGATNTLDVICPNGLRGETEALEITPDGLITPDGQLLVGTHKVPFGLHAFDAQTCQVIEADETLSNQYHDVEGIAVPVAACGSLSTSSSCAALAEEDLQVFEAIFLEPFTLYIAIRSMVVVDYDVMGEWPIPLSTSITPPTGNFTAGFVSGPLYLEATMKSQAELETALAPFNLDMANKACLAEVAGKVIRFNFNPSTRIWSCSVNIPNGVPPQHLDLFPMTCD